MLPIGTLADLVESGEIHTVVAGFTDHYGRLVGKRFDATFFLDSVVDTGAHACDYLLAVDMEMEPVPGYRFANWDRGFGDVHLVPDLTTLRRADWLDATAIVLCDVQDQATHAPVPIAPRRILRAQIDRAAGQGVRLEAATELEYYLFRTSYREAAASGYADLEPAGWYVEDYQLLQGARTESFHAVVRRHLAASGIPPESSKGEWGLGQHELNIRHAGVLEAADRHVLLKQCLKEVAERQGMGVTFMAKPIAERAGSSCHIHMSLWRDGRNTFVGDRELGPVRGSDELCWFLGGCLAHVPEVMALLAPTVNSYKRYVAGSWAPTRLSWSYDNRTAGFRLVGHDESLRIECRIPGADCNPYLALAALLASGLDGLAQHIEPPMAYVGNAYDATELAALPMRLGDAAAAFSASTFAEKAFGPDVVEHYTHFFQAEQAAYDAAVTDWERRRYFERI